jgi:hypothetical protein
MTSRSSRSAAVALFAMVATALALGHAQRLEAKEDWPQVSPDGLQLKKSSDHGAVYLKPGATFSQYDRLSLVDCFVDFAKDWQRDYNENEPDLTHRVTQSDVDRIKTEVAAEFRKVFTEELQTKGGYQIVDTAAPDVLVLRPAIINLVVTAPDLNTPDMSASVVASAGQMTLYLELWDSATNTLLARVIDAEADPGAGGLPQQADSVTNKAAADRILKAWADKLRKRLDEVRSQPAAAPSPQN